MIYLDFADDVDIADDGFIDFIGPVLIAFGISDD